MKILDFYIIKKFLTTFIYVVLLLVLIIVVIDFVEKNDDYIEKKVPYTTVIFDYYLYFAPYIANMLSPITVFIAVVFVTSKLASHSEIIAILTSGVNYTRFLVPYLISALFIGIITYWLIGWIIPDSNKKRIAFEIEYIKNVYTFNQRDIHLKIGENSYIYMESYNNFDNVGYKLCMEHIENNRLLKKLLSNRIQWNETQKNWHIDDYTLRTFDDEKEKLTMGASKDTVIMLSPADFASDWQKEETLTNSELDKFIETQRARGRDNLESYIVKKYQRFTYPFATLVLTFIGVIVSSRKSRGGIGYVIALGFLLAFAYIIFVIMSSSIATNGSVHPLLAVWLPNIIFSIVGLIMLFTIPK